MHTLEVFKCQNHRRKRVNCKHSFNPKCHNTVQVKNVEIDVLPVRQCGNIQSVNLYVCCILYSYYVFPFVIHLRRWPGGGAYAVYPLTSVALARGAVSVRSL